MSILYSTVIYVTPCRCFSVYPGTVRTVWLNGCPHAFCVALFCRNANSTQFVCGPPLPGFSFLYEDPSSLIFWEILKFFFSWIVDFRLELESIRLRNRQIQEYVANHNKAGPKTKVKWRNLQHFLQYLTLWSLFHHMFCMIGIVLVVLLALVPWNLKYFNLFVFVWWFNFSPACYTSAGKVLLLACEKVRAAGS